MDMGYLTKCTSYSVDEIDFTDIKMSMGDYKISETFNKLDDVKIYGDAIKNYKKFADHSRCIIFCINIDHSITTC